MGLARLARPIWLDATIQAKINWQGALCHGRLSRMGQCNEDAVSCNVPFVYSVGIMESRRFPTITLMACPLLVGCWHGTFVACVGDYAHLETLEEMAFVVRQNLSLRLRAIIPKATGPSSAAYSRALRARNSIARQTMTPMPISRFPVRGHSTGSLFSIVMWSTRCAVSTLIARIVVAGRFRKTSGRAMLERLPMTGRDLTLLT